MSFKFYSGIKINVLEVAYGRALRSNLFVRTSQKGFPLQSLTQNQKIKSIKKI